MKTIKLLLSALLLAALTACTNTRFHDPATGVEFERTSFLTKQNVSKLEAKAGADGSKSVTIEGYSNDQTEIAAAVAGSVAKALAPGAK